MAQLSSDFPCLSQDPDSGYLNPESWMVLPTTPETAFLPDAVSESKFRAIPHRPHSLYPFIRQDTSELILCLGSCETCCTNWKCRFWCMYWLHHACINMNTHTCMQGEKLVYKPAALPIWDSFWWWCGGEFSFPKIVLYSLNLFPFILREYTFWSHARVLGTKCYICHGWECVSVKGIQAPLWPWPLQQSVAWISSQHSERVDTAYAMQMRPIIVDVYCEVASLVCLLVIYHWCQVKDLSNTKKASLLPASGWL